MFITVFTTGRHMSLLSDRSIQPKPSLYPISLISIPPPPPKKHKLFTTIDVFLTKAHGVLCEVRTESLHIMTVEQLASGSAPRPPSFSCPSHPACPPRHRTHTRSHLVTPSQNHTPVFGSGVADHRKIFSRTRRRVQPTTRRNTF